MAIGGDLVVNLATSTARMQRGLNQGQDLLKGFARKAVGILGVLGGGALLKSSVSLWEEQRQSVAKLEAVLKATGGAAGLSSQAIQDFASQRQAVTNFGDEATIAGAAVLATFKEIKGEAFQETIQLAQDMTTILGGDLKGASVQLGKALNDPIKGISALSRSGVSFTEQQKEQIRTLQESGDILGAQRIILDELQSEFGGAAEAVASPWTQFKNNLGDLGEKLGQLVSGPGDGLAEWMSGLVIDMQAGIDTIMGWRDAFTTALGDSSTAIGATWAAAKAFFSGMRDGFSFLFFAATNWELAWPAITEAMVAGVQVMGARLQWFGGVIGDWLGWVWRNWSEVWRTARDFVLTLFINLGTNIREVFSAAWRTISSGFKEDFAPQLVSLTEGFVSTIREEFELRDFVGPQVETAARERLRGAFEEYKRMSSEVAQEQAQVVAQSVAAISPAAATEGLTKRLEKGAAATALRVGTSEALSRVLATSRGGGSPEKTTAANTTKLVEKAAEQIRETRRLADKLGTGKQLEVVGR